jgi:hypothetical protein
MSEHAPTASASAPTGLFSSWRYTMRSVRAFFDRNLTPKTGTAVVVWRVEAWLAGPMALALVASLGRWNGALVTGVVMASLSVLFLFLFDGERVIDEIRRWVGDRDWGHWSMNVAERRDWRGAVLRALSVPVTIMLMGPFVRSLTYHIFKVRRGFAYPVSIGGQMLHNLFWTGIVLGSFWEILFQPALSAVWDSAITPLFGLIF